MSVCLAGTESVKYLSIGGKVFLYLAGVQLQANVVSSTHRMAPVRLRSGELLGPTHWKALLFASEPPLVRSHVLSAKVCSL